MPLLRLKWMLWLLVPVVAASGGYWMGLGATDLAPPPVLVEEAARKVEEPAAPQRPASPRLMATVAGAVRVPGAYALSGDARVQDLIDAGGGLREDAVMADINIAARVTDGSVLTIPQRLVEGAAGRDAFLAQPAARLNSPAYTRSGWVAPDTASGAAAGSGSGAGLVDLNTASQALLETLPGVGPVTAGKIIEYRSMTPFTRVEDLTNIHGVGEKTLETLRPLVTVR